MEIPETKRFIPKGFELGTTLRACLHGGEELQVGEVTCLCGVKKQQLPSRGAPSQNY